MVFKKVTFYLFCLVLAVILNSCSTDSELLDEEGVEKQIKLITQERLDSLKPQWRQYCDNNLGEHINFAVDSMVTEYLKNNPIDTSLLNSTTTINTASDEINE